MAVGDPDDVVGDVVEPVGRRGEGELGGALDTLDLGAYTDATIEPGLGLTVTPGLRVDYFRYVGQDRVTFDPRLVVRWRATRTFARAPRSWITCSACSGSSTWDAPTWRRSTPSRR